MVNVVEVTKTQVSEEVASLGRIVGVRRVPQPLHPHPKMSAQATMWQFIILYRSCNTSIYMVIESQSFHFH